MKIVKLLSLWMLFLTTTLMIVACNTRNDFLEITNDDIYDENIELTKLNKIAEFFLFTEPKKSKCNKGLRWRWNIKNRKLIVGKANCGYSDYNDNWKTKWEYWVLKIQKTRFKNIYISDWKMTNEKPLDWED